MPPLSRRFYRPGLAGTIPAVCPTSAAAYFLRLNLNVPRKLVCEKCAGPIRRRQSSSIPMPSALRRPTTGQCGWCSDLLPIGRASRRLVESVSRGRNGHEEERFTDEQIVGFLKQAEAGLPVKELCRKGGFSDATFYKWRARFGGMEASDARMLREVQAENSKLKKLLAEAHLDIEALKVGFGVKR